jgi:hypothetical protein
VAKCLAILIKFCGKLDYHVLIQLLKWPLVFYADFLDDRNNINTNITQTRSYPVDPIRDELPDKAEADELDGKGAEV